MFFNKLNNKGNLAGIDVNSINEAKQKAKENLDKKSEQFDDIYKDALKYFQEFIKTKDNKIIKKSAVRFAQALALKRSVIEPYYYLSIIYYLFNENKLALEYYKIANSIDSKHPLLAELKQLLSKCS